jgi:uncharacterized protein
VNGRLVDSVAAVGCPEWAALCGDRFYLGAEWLEAFAARRRPLHAVALAEDEDGIAAALPCWGFTEAHGNSRYDIGALWQRLSGDGAAADGWSPQLLLGGVSGYQNGLLRRPGLSPAEEAAVVDELRRMVETLRREWRCASAAALYSDADDLPLFLRVLGPKAQPLLSSAACSLTLEGTDFDAYVAQLRKSRRTSTRRERKAFDASGGCIQVGRLAGQEEELAPLLAAVERRYGGDQSSEDSLEFLRSWATPALDELALVFRCERGGALVAFSLGYQYGDAVVMRVVGIDYDRSQRGDYFETLFYAPIREALERGARSIHFGSESYRAKILRGCAVEPLWSAIDGERVSAHATAASNERALERWQEELEELVGQLPQTWRQPATSGAVVSERGRAA